MRNAKGPAFVGLKISPVTTHHDTHDSDPYETYHVLLHELTPFRDIAYLTVQTTMNFVQPGEPAGALAAAQTLAATDPKSLAV